MRRDKKSYDNMLGNAYAQVAISTTVRPCISGSGLGLCCGSFGAQVAVQAHHGLQLSRLPLMHPGAPMRHVPAHAEMPA